MRSIRRSMTVYLLVLLAITLGVVWVVIDQVTARALAAREAAGAELIQKGYDERVREEKEHTDEVLLQQAKELGNFMQIHYNTNLDAEGVKFQQQMAAVQLLFGPAGLPGVGNQLLASTSW